MKTANSSTICPHCQKESVRQAVLNIQVDHQPEMRQSVQDFSCFRWECPNCGVASLVVDPCLYHDMANEFMVWLSPEGKPVSQSVGQLENYTLRYVDDLNTFREKINVLERGLDDRVVEIMKYLLLVQLKNDLDVVELLFHTMDERTLDFRFVAVLSDGAEQYISMPATTYQQIAQDVRERLYEVRASFVKIDLAWAGEALKQLHE